MPTAFVSYRRDDAPDSAAPLVRSLSRRLGDDKSTLLQGDS